MTIKKLIAELERFPEGLEVQGFNSHHGKFDLKKLVRQDRHEHGTIKHYVNIYINREKKEL